MQALGKRKFCGNLVFKKIRAYNNRVRPSDAHTIFHPTSRIEPGGRVGVSDQ